MDRFQIPWRLLLLSALGACAALHGAATVTRAIPAHFTPGQTLSVTLAVAPGPSTQVQAFEETPPADWPVSAISHGGSFDVVNQRVKWGPFLDATPRTLTYQLDPPPNAVGTHTCFGEAVLDSTRLTVGGALATTKFPGTLTRNQAASYLPGVALPVTLNTTPASNVQAWAVEELVPDGWTVSNLGADGAWDARNRKVKWGPFFDATPRTLGYTVTAPASERATATLAAFAQFDAAILTVEATLPPQPSSLIRTAPSAYLPNIGFTVTLTATPAPYVQTLAVEEQLPDGWTPAALSSGGSFDTVNRKVKWGPFTAGLSHPLLLSYELVPPTGSSASLPLLARGRFDAVEVTSSHQVNRSLVHTDSSVVRSLPSHYVPGVPVTVSLQADPIDTAMVYGIEESVPLDWTVTNLSAGGVFDAANRLLKWGPYFDTVATPRTLTYQATPPPLAYGEVTFQGNARFDQAVRIVTGASLIRAQPATVTRAALARYTSGTPLLVTLAATPVPGIEVYALEEAVPSGWIVTSLTDGGAVDPFSGHIKWGPFTDRNLRTLTYTVTPPPAATGTLTLAGQGFFNRDSTDISGMSQFSPNTPPVAAPDVVTRRPGESAKISVTRLLSNDTDADGDFLRILSITSTSTLGGTVQMVWPWIYYTPPPGPDAPDSFTCFIGDPFGGTVSVSVSILIGNAPPGPAQNIIGIQVLPNGHRLIRFACVPGLTYHVEASSDLSTWNRLGDATAGATGQFSWDDADATAYPVRFYRSTWP